MQAPSRSGRKRKLSERVAAAIEDEAASREEKRLANTARLARARDEALRRAEKAAKKARDDAARHKVEVVKAWHGVMQQLVSQLAQDEKEAAKEEAAKRKLLEKEEKERKAREKAVVTWLDGVLLKVEKKVEADAAVLPPSAAADGATHSDAAMLALLARAADRALAGRNAAFCDKVAPSYAPLHVEPPSAAVLAFAAAAKKLLHAAYAAAKALGPKQGVNAQMLFKQRALSLTCSADVRALLALFAELAPEVLAPRANESFMWLWRLVIDNFSSENALLPPPSAAASEAAAPRPTELTRDVYAYLAGWGLHRLKQRDTPAHRDAVKALIAPGGRLEVGEPALDYLLAREVFGGLTHPSSETISAMSLVGAWLVDQLSEKHIAAVGPSAAFNGVTALISNDAGVKAAFAAAFAVEGELSEAQAAVTTALLELVFLSAAKAMVQQYRKTITEARKEGSLAIRKKLKAEVLKEVTKEAPVLFTAKSISKGLSARSLHLLLCIVNEEAPGQLEAASVRQLRGVLGAYAADDDELERSLRGKTPPKVPLVAAVQAAIATRAVVGFVRPAELVF